MCICIILCYSHTLLGCPSIPEYGLLYNIMINGYLDNPVMLIAEEEEEEKYFFVAETIYDSVGITLMEFTKF